MCLVICSGPREFSPCQRRRDRSASSATRELAASRRVGTKGIWRVRKPSMPIGSRTAQRMKASGKAATVSRASHVGRVCGCNHVTRGSWGPHAVCPRERGRPVTAGVRRTRGRTKSRPGVTSTICRAPTHRTACTLAWTRRATGADAHRPRSATRTSPGCTLGWTAGIRASACVKSGATARVRSTPVPAWTTPTSRATGTPHPGRGSVGWPKAACNAGVAGMEQPEPSTSTGRGPGHRPSSATWDGPAAQTRASRRAKRSRGRVVRA